MSQFKENNSAGFINEVEKFSGSKLKRKAEVIRLYEEAKKHQKEFLFEDMVFTAKYVQGLMRAVKSASGNSEITNIEQIKKDFSDNVKKVVDQIRDIISNSGDEMKSYFEKTYFNMTQQSFMNLNELLYDLERCKMYMNDLKRKGK